MKHHQQTVCAGNVSTLDIFSVFVVSKTHQSWFLGIIWSNSCCKGEIWPWEVGLIPCSTWHIHIHVFLYLLLCLFIYQYLCLYGFALAEWIFSINAQNSSMKGEAIHLSMGNLHQNRRDGWYDAGGAHSCWWEALVEENFGLKSLKTQYFNLFLSWRFPSIYTVLFLWLLLSFGCCFFFLFFFLTPPVCQKLAMAQQGWKGQWH